MNDLKFGSPQIRAYQFMAEHWTSLTIDNATVLFANLLCAERRLALEECEKELEKAFDECETLNLLHGAARIRALGNKDVPR